MKKLIEYLPMIVIYLLGAIGLLSAIALANRWGVEQLGTVSSWVSAAGAIATCIGVGIAARTYWVQRQDELEDQASQARLVVAYHPTLHAKRDNDGGIVVQVRIKNRSDRTVFNVQIHHLRFVVDDGGEPVAMMCTAPVDVLETTQWLGDTPREAELAPDAEFSTLWRAADDDRIAPPGITLSYSLTDANGRTWVIGNGREPRKLNRS
ncbi:hypothetical protein [Gordonia terrae]|uniref:hypothetical protein n=1 Tax=Gordonia terrae TaxID=2055 RepID=UPI003F6A76C8